MIFKYTLIGLALVTLSLNVSSTFAQTVVLSDQEQQMIDWVDQHRDEILAEAYSSDDIEILSCKGGSIKIADHLVATRTGSANNRVLINGHMDTVFSKGDEFQTLVIEDNGVLKGPGVADMKGGIVVMINAIIWQPELARALVKHVCA